jgi:hypothetical protein
VDSSRRLVQLPLTSLWTEAGELTARKVRDELTADDVRELLRRNTHVQFVSAYRGSTIEWIPLKESYTYWKSGVQDRLTQWGPENRIYTDDFPHGYAIASLWESDQVDRPIVVISEND